MIKYLLLTILFLGTGSTLAQGSKPPKVYENGAKQAFESFRFL